jgi:hypothetical protein
MDVQEFVTEHRSELARSGSVVASFRRRGLQRCGPYWRLTCRDAQGRQRSAYLGVEGPALEEARRLLAEIQAPRDLRRQLQRAKQAARRSAKSARLQLDEELAAVGLRRQGNKFRGWRQATRLLNAEMEAKGEAGD